MIHIFVGTKAQFIKMMPIVRTLEMRQIAYNFIDTGQHASLTGDLTEQFGLRQPDIILRQERTDISTIAQAIRWTIRHLVWLTLKHKLICKKIFKEENGICLIHGDTLTTLISLFYAKRCGLHIAHVEAGLRSFNLFDPFPEEIIRLITMHFSDLLFAPSKWAFENLCKMGYYTKAVNVGANTGIEAIFYALSQAKGKHGPDEPYVVVTIHRVETIYSGLRLKMIADLIERIASKRKVLFVMHEPTRQQLLRFGLLSKIKQLESVELLPLLPYMEFIGLVGGSDFVITDGGSIQEECYYLNKPCMIMRTKTERIEGLGENSFLVEFDQHLIDRFFRILPTLKRKKFKEALNPSDVIVDQLLPWA